MEGPKRVQPGSGNMWQMASLGTELAAAVIGGCILGWWVDRAFGFGHWGLIVGAIIGIVGGLYNLIRKAVHESLGLTDRKSDGQGPTESDGAHERHQRPGGGNHP